MGSADGQRVGGIVLIIDAEKGARRYRALVRRQRPEGQERGGADIVAAAEGRYPSVKTWELYPYVETRNIHFYVNKCGYKIVEFFNPKHPSSCPGERVEDGSSSVVSCSSSFEKKMGENEVT